MANSAQSKLTDFRHPETNCPSCKHHIDAASGTGNEGPKDGDISICFYCGEILKFRGENITLDLITEEELLELKVLQEETYHQVLHYQESIRIRRAMLN